MADGYNDVGVRQSGGRAEAEGKKMTQGPFGNSHHIVWVTVSEVTLAELGWLGGPAGPRAP